MKHDQEPLDERAVERVLHVAEGTDLSAAVVVAATTGLRLRELLALQWSDVDTAGGWIFVRRSLARGGTAAPKGGSQTVAAPSEALDALTGERERQARRHAALGLPQDDETPIFTTRTGTLWTSAAFLFAFRRLVAKLPERVYFHDLRKARLAALWRGHRAA